MRVWTVSEAKAGTRTQCLGVAKHLDPNPNVVEIQKKLPRWRKGILSPYRNIQQPEPDVVISCGYMSPRHVIAIADACRVRPLTVHLQEPQAKYTSDYDLAFMSRHDWTDLKEQQPNFRQMVGVPHQFDAQRISGGRDAARARWAPDGRPVVTILIGGPNNAYRYEEETIRGLGKAAQELAAAGWTVLVSTSRRSTPETLSHLLELKGENLYVWDRTGDNPYAEFMFAADAFVITKDTITMTCEALATGNPVYIFDLPKTPCTKLDEFEWFHADFHKTLGLTRPFEGRLERYDYEPLDEAKRIAGVISETVAARKSVREAAGASL